MKSRRFLSIGTIVLVTLIAFAMLAPAALASHVEPVQQPGNPVCPAGTETYKIDSAPGNGVYTIPGTSQTITISNANGIYFDWASTLGMDAVIVKGGPNANVYYYNPESFGDNGLHSPINNDQPYGLSHVSFCYDYELGVSKTATTEWHVDYTWSIRKDADGSYTMFAGESTGHNYNVAVTRHDNHYGWKVFGAVTIHNPSPMAVSYNVNDTLYGQNVPVVCDANPVGPGGTATCTYEVLPGGTTPGTNFAEVTSNTNGVNGGYAEAPVVWGDAIPHGYAQVSVSDDIAGGLGSAGGGTTNFPYSNTFSCSTNLSDYTDGHYSYTVVNTAKINETGQSDNATVTVNCYAPQISKSAAGKYDERHEWDITKTVNPTSISGNAGETLGYNWTVDLVESVFEENFAVGGQISVTNPNPSAAMTVGLSDVLNDGTAASITSCANGTLSGSSLTVGAGQTATCEYSASPDGRTATLNTATATLNGLSVSANADIGWTANVIRPDVTVDDDSNPNFPVDVSDGNSWTYPDSYTCSSNPDDYGDNGMYTADDDNTATVSEGATELDRDSAHIDFTCYAPVVSKSAAGDYVERHSWDITKTVDPTSASGNAGETLDYDWTVDLEETVTEEDFAVTGTISVQNPNPGADMTVSLSDYLDDGTAASLTDCADTINVAAGTTANCGYVANPGNRDATENQVDATFNGIVFSATAPVEWTPDIIDPTVTVDDDSNANFPVDVSDGNSWTYPDSYTCSSNPDDYDDNGMYTDSDDNTATVSNSDGVLDSDDAHIDFTCYAPVVSKSAAASYDRDWDWTIVKSGDQTSLTLSAGQVFTVNYDVALTASYEDFNLSVDGQISVHNPNPDADMTVSLSDVLSDGTAASLTDCDATITVAAGTTSVCTYTATPPNKNSGTNTATATLNNIDFTASADYAFGDPANETDECVDVNDDQYGPLGQFCASEGQMTFSASYSMDLSYDTCGLYQFTNVASFRTNDNGETGESSWTIDIDVPCGGCSLTQGYWKTHSIIGPAPYDETWALVGEDTLFFNSGLTWYELFWTSPQGGNVYIQLAHQYMAARLNQLNGADTSAINDVLDAAADWFADQDAGIPDVKGKDAKDAREWASTLDAYNNGNIGPGHCDEDSSSG